MSQSIFFYSFSFTHTEDREGSREEEHEVAHHFVDSIYASLTLPMLLRKTREERSYALSGEHGADSGEESHHRSPGPITTSGPGGMSKKPRRRRTAFTQVLIHSLRACLANPPNHFAVTTQLSRKAISRAKVFERGRPRTGGRGSQSL